MIETRRCVCGYKHGYDYERKEIVDGYAEFIPVEVTVLIPVKWERGLHVQVYACPKCGTLKIDEGVF